MVHTTRASPNRTCLCTTATVSGALAFHTIPVSCTCARKSHSQHLQSDELELWPDGIWLSSVPSQGLLCTVSLPNFSWKGTCRGKMRDIGSVLLAWRFACHFLFLCFWRIKNEAEKEKEGKRSIIYTTNDYYYYYSIIIATSSTRTRRAEVALGIYIRPFSSIELACAVRQPGPCVRALCESGVLFHMSHLKLHFALHTSHFPLHSSHFTLHTSHFTVHTSHLKLLSPHFTLHPSHFTLHSAHFTLHTALFTPHTSHWTLHTPHFISSELFSPYPSSSLLISSLLICHLSFHESLPSTTTKELACAVRQPGPCVRALCESGVLFHMSHLKLHFALHTSHCTLHTPHCTLHTSHFTLHTSHFTLHSSQSTLHTSHSTLHTSQSTLHTSHFSLLSSHSTLHTPHFTLHSSRPTLHTALFTLHTSSHLSSSHLIPAHLFSSHLFSYVT